MAYTTIKHIISVEEIKGYVITTIEDDEGNICTGVGEYKVGTRVMTFMDDRYNRVKFKPVVE